MTAGSEGPRSVATHVGRSNERDKMRANRAMEPIREALADTPAFSRPHDVRHTHGPDHHAVQDGGQKPQSIEIDTPEGPVMLHVTPKAPVTGTTVELEVVPLAPGDAGTDLDQDGPHDGAMLALDRAEQALESIVSVEDVLVALDRIEAMRAVLRRVDRTHAVANRCAVLRLRAQRRGGRFLLETERAKGGGDHRSPTVTGAPTLADLGVKKRQSGQWRALATIADDVFEHFIKNALRSGEELSTAAVLAAHDSNGRPRKIKRTKAAPAKARPVKTVQPTASNVPPRRAAVEPEAAPFGMGNEPVAECATVRDEIDNATGVQNAGSPSEPRGEVAAMRKGRGRRTTAVPESDRAVRNLLRDLRDLGLRALELDGGGLTRVLREVEGLIAALSARIQEEHEAAPEFDVAPDLDPTDAPGLPVDAYNLDGDGESWEEVE